jgi:hypothetical protein
MTRFEFLMMIAAVVVAVGMTEIVGGWGRLMRTRAVIKADWLHLGWSIWILAILIQYWIGMWAYNQQPIYYMGQIFFLIIPTLFGVLAAFAITPDVPMVGELDVREYYWAKRTAVFLPLAAFFLLAYVADLAIVGVDKVGFDQLFINVVGMVMLVLLTITKRLWFHVVVLGCMTANTVAFLFQHTSNLGTKWAG